MIKSTNVNDRKEDCTNFTEKEINEAYEDIKKACIKQFYLESSTNGGEPKVDKRKIKKIFTSYFNIKNPILNINEPIPGMEWTPIMLSSWFGANECVETLLKLGADPSQLYFSKKDNCKKINAFHMAIMNKKEDLAIFLLKNNPKILKVKTNNGQTPLMLACEASLIKLVEELLKFDVDLKEKDNDGNDFEYYCIKANENFINIENSEYINKLISYHMLNKELKKNPIIKNKVVKI